MQLKELNMRPEEDGRVIIPAEVLEAIGTNADGLARQIAEHLLLVEYILGKIL